MADLGSFNRAAERLNLSPSAVSGLVSGLEASLGFSLFERTTRRVDLSGAGRAFLPSAQSTIRQMQLAAAAANDIARGQLGMVRVAAPLVVASVVLPPAIASFQAEHPKVVVRIVDTAVDRLAAVVAEGDADLAVGVDRVAPPGMICQKLYPSPWVLWCSPNNPLARKHIVRWSDLYGIRLCAAGRDHEQSIAQMTRDAHVDRPIVPTQIVDNMSTALGLAAADLAVTVSPAYVKPFAEQFGLVMRRIIDPEIIRHMALYRPEGRTMSPAAEAFSSFVAAKLRIASVEVMAE